MSCTPGLITWNIPPFDTDKVMCPEYSEVCTISATGSGVTPAVEWDGTEKEWRRTAPAEAPEPETAPPSSDVKVASEPAGDSLLSASEEQHQQRGGKDPRPQLSQDADREAGEASAPSNSTPNSDAEENERRSTKKKEGGGGGRKDRRQ
ncbi:surface protease GP63 [Trypanosoma conorhini]|uniref:Surface protease GP63 n=1 Tax=Trypanosoma conorhini TaxID=83891 RepID=A0A3R7KDF5_9TRYP|nr:surface protease GP63 [Trypanosoma conorhini]RNE98286.1 surface protease GP63 [Trypanosoma conorhini]